MIAFAVACALLMLFLLASSLCTYRSYDRCAREAELRRRAERVWELEDGHGIPRSSWMGHEPGDPDEHGHAGSALGSRS